MARIMIAEDSDATRLVLKDILKIGCHEIVAEAVDGIEAIKKFSETNPDVLLLDVAMPKKDGILVLEEIMSSNPYAKIIMITADESFSTIQQSTKDGALAYIVKPFNFEKILTAISMALS